MKVNVKIVRGVAGLAVYVNDRRIAGPKPWGGGSVVQEHNVEAEDVLTAVAQGSGGAIPDHAPEGREP